MPTNIALSLHFFFIRKRKGFFTKENPLKLYNHTSILGVKWTVRRGEDEEKFGDSGGEERGF
jgi:hypothetical protein